MSTTEHKLCGT